MHSEDSVPAAGQDGTLLVIGSNPPTTSGQRTLARAEQARLVLGFGDFDVANLFSLPTYRSGGVALAGTSASGWMEARPTLSEALDKASAVLLAYGITKPSGTAAKHHVEQVTWLEEQISQRALPVWSVGGAPRHPSRWHRYTYRAYPGIAFPDALVAALGKREPVASS